MPWYSGLIFVVLLLAGCASNQPTIGKKSFDKEDEYIIKGLLYEDTNTTKAINTFKFLYDKTDKYVYLKEIIKLNFENKKYKTVINLVNKFMEKYPKLTDEVILYKIDSYIILHKLNQALECAKNYIKKYRNIEVYKRIAYIYIKQQKYTKAIKYLKTIYSINHSPEILSQMGDIFFKYLKKPNEAISYYQTYINEYGCEDNICNRLSNIYSSLYDYEDLISIYKKMYYYNPTDEYARKIIYLYMELGEYNKALEFINKYNLDERLKYLVYKSRFDTLHTYKDAYRLYKITHKNRYFFLYTTYKFQHSKKSLLSLTNLIANLELLIKKERNPLYLNYLGYMLIDYNINPKKGIKLVKEALISNPNDPAFLDSLAWGYYKIHKCKKAYDIISKIKSKDKDIFKHKKLIRRCYDSRKNNK